MRTFTFIDKLDIDEDAKERHRTFVTEMVTETVDLLLKEMEATGAPNFVMLAIADADDPETHYTLMLQRGSGSPPAKVINDLQAEVAQLRARLDQVSAELDHEEERHTRTIVELRDERARAAVRELTQEAQAMGLYDEEER